VNLDVLEKDTENLIQAVELNPGLVIPIIQLKRYDDFTFTHSLNVAIIALFIGKFLNLSKEELLILGLGALVHDLGKLKIPAEILHKPKKLDEKEFLIVKKHPVDAKKILEEQAKLNNNKSQLIAFQHHEKINGSGYPLGLGSKEIDFFSQITTVADIYEALTSDRPYRKGLPVSEVIEYLMGNAGYRLNMEVVEAFVRHISPYQVGDLVRLSDGREAIVSELNPVLPFRPKVRIKVEDEQGKPYLAEEVDLARTTTLTITEELLSKSKIILKD
jgi:HD-GYP domain-containing protein (c-di-GMP phosphodiesterase class II)